MRQKLTFYVGLEVLISLDMVSIETFVLDSSQNDILTIQKVSTVLKSQVLKVYPKLLIFDMVLMKILDLDSSKRLHCPIEKS